MFRIFLVPFTAKMETLNFLIMLIIDSIMRAGDQALNMIAHGETKKFSKQMGEPTFSFQ